MLGLWRKGEGSDVRRALKQVRRRQAWMRRLPPRELERIVATVESDLERFPTKDSLLEHLARLHFDARARQEAIGLEEARRHPDSARRIVETAIFERRYGVKLTEELDLGGPSATRSPTRRTSTSRASCGASASSTRRSTAGAG